MKGESNNCNQVYYIEHTLLGIDVQPCTLSAHLSNLMYSYAYSYGSDWGVYGYMQMLRNANHCGIAMDAGFPVV